MPTAFQDYYAILGVPRTATQKEIKAAFRKLARKHHPDLNQGDPAAERRFKEANEANEVLSDPEKRRLYDEVGPRWREYESWDKAGRPGASPFAAPGGGGGGPLVQYRSVSPDELESMFGEADPFSDFFHSMFGRSGGSRQRTATVTRRGDDVEGSGRDHPRGGIHRHDTHHRVEWQRSHATRRDHHPPPASLTAPASAPPGRAGGQRTIHRW